MASPVEFELPVGDVTKLLPPLEKALPLVRLEAPISQLE